MLTINNTVDGYLKNVQIKGNTVQDPVNLSSIKSVGTKVEGQDLYEIPLLCVGKNLNSGLKIGGLVLATGAEHDASTDRCRTDFIKVSTSKIRTSIGGQVPSVGVYLFQYDKNKSFIKQNNGHNFTIEPNTCYIRVVVVATDTDVKLQIELGDNITPYEQYKEDKLTILSPVQLEKGDVLKEVDGVWGVEKNRVNCVLLRDMNWILQSVNSYGVGNFYISVVNDNFKSTDLISNVPVQTSLIADTTTSGVMMSNTSNLYLRLKDVSNVTGCKEYLSNNYVVVKYITTTPTFIPLPHSQQVKLRTFANKTNISFLTETEGTIKADVPKSLGATVNTHTTQIDSLHQELERVKKLEESTVSTVTTDKDFTVVEQTAQGYFEDITLQGRTLVNLCDGKSVSTGTTKYMGLNCKDRLSAGYYTLINSCGRPFSVECKKKSDNMNTRNISITSIGRINLSSDEYMATIFVAESNGWTDSNKNDLLNTLILEGDHTQNPPSYFTGLASVGEGTDEIVVSSVSNGIDNSSNKYIEINNSTGVETESNSVIISTYNLVTKYVDTVFLYDGTTLVDKPITKRFYDRDKKYIGSSLTSNAKYARYRCAYGSAFPTATFGYVFRVSSDLKMEHKTDKKRLLFYNPTTQVWEKPVLREWNSVEKHADGKYYYHKRSEEVVLDGSENIIKHGSLEGMFILTKNSFINALHSENDISCICNLYTPSKYYPSTDKGISTGDKTSPDRIFIKDMSCSDVPSFKAWLQANNVTVVYQLAKEEVYECTNIDLITYENETNFNVKSGVLSPKTTLKVHSNISNVVSLLQKKVSLLESNMTKYMITQNRLMLASRYNADSASFKIDYNSMYSEKLETEVDEDLFKLLQHNIIVGIDNYDYNKMIDMMDFYAINGFISWDMWDELWIMMELQHNPPVEVPEETPEI